MLWNNPNISSISEVQEILNELGADAIKMFAAHAAMGQAIETAESGAVPEKMKSCPVAYEVADGRIILDQNAEYPIQ